MPLLLQQDYPNFEILLVNDFSVDYSLDYLKSIESEKIRVIHASKNVKGKKHALKEAIELANGDLILLTDADCRPGSSLWMKTMVESMKPNQDIVLGYGPLNYNSTIISKLSSFETWFHAFQSFSVVKKGLAYLGVGRNLLIRKSAIHLKSLFEGSNSISGDDDLLVQHISTGRNVGLSLNKTSYVFSNAKSTWKDYINQKSRHLSNSWEYKPLFIFLLGLYGASHGILILSFFFLLVLKTPLVLLLPFIIFTGLKWVIAAKGMKVIDDRRFCWSFPIYDLLMGLNYWLLLFLLFKKPNKW